MLCKLHCQEPWSDPMSPGTPLIGLRHHHMTSPDDIPIPHLSLETTALSKHGIHSHNPFSCHRRAWTRRGGGGGALGRTAGMQQGLNPRSIFATLQ